jgi:hypothetical protein
MPSSASRMTSVGPFRPLLTYEDKTASINNQRMLFVEHALLAELAPGLEG